jgi:YbbR domain-containing protein
MREWFGWLTRNWGMKLMSLLLAVGFWFYVVGEESIEMTKMIPLEIRPPSEKISVVSSTSRLLAVTFQSPRHLVPAISSSTINAVHQIDQNQKAGSYSFTVVTSDIVLPYPQIRIVKIFPSVVTVKLDEMIVKKLPIEVDLMGDAAYGYRVDKNAIELDPNAVLVEGPKDVLEKMDKIKTEQVQLVGRARSFRRTVRIHQEPEMRIMGDGITDVQVPIKAEYATKEFANIPVRTLGYPDKSHYAVLDREAITLTVKGPQALLDSLKMSDILMYAEVEGLNEGAYQIPVKLILPPDIILDGDQPEVRATIKKM